MGMTIDQIGELLESRGATDTEINVYLEHFGVKGMHWGVRRAEKQAARSRNRELNRTSRTKDKEEWAKSVQKARDRLESGKSNEVVFKAKQEYAKNKQELGSREARKILNKARDKKMQDINMAQQAKNGKEAAAMIGVMMAAFGISALLASKGA